MEVAVAKVPAERETSDEFPVDPLVVFEAFDCAREQGLDLPMIG